MANVSDRLVLLYPGHLICQLILIRITPEDMENSSNVDKLGEDECAKRGN